MTTAKILSCYIAKFESFVAAKNKKAEKLGCQKIAFEISAPFVVYNKEEDRNYEYVNVTVDESLIAINGYSVVGRIDDFEGSVIATGFSDMAKYRNVSMTRCDHCNEARARKHLVILKSEADEKVVGSTCLVDFIGHKSALSYLSAMSWVLNLQDALDEEGFGSGRGHDVFDVKDLLTLCAAVARETGYVSRAKAEECMSTPTVDVIRSHLFSNREESRIKPIEVDGETAEKAIAWLETVEEDSDFFYNLKTLVNKGYVNNRFIGLAIGLIPAYLRSLNKVPTVPSEFIANIGDKKVKFENAECVSVVALQGDYGTSWMMLFKMGNNIVKYVSASFQAKVGDIFNMTATIKDHSVYNGTKQTVITRAKVI